MSKLDTKGLGLAEQAKQNRMIPRFCCRPEEIEASFVSDLDTTRPASQDLSGDAGGNSNAGGEGQSRARSTCPRLCSPASAPARAETTTARQVVAKVAAHESQRRPREPHHNASQRPVHGLRHQNGRGQSDEQAENGRGGGMENSLEDFNGQDIALHGSGSTKKRGITATSARAHSDDGHAPVQDTRKGNPNTEVKPVTVISEEADAGPKEMATSPIVTTIGR